MPKYSSPKQIVGISNPYVQDPRPGSNQAEGYWYGDESGNAAHAEGVYIDYIYADGTKETRFFYRGQGPETGHAGVFVDSKLDAAQHNEWLEDQATKEPGRPPAQTPEQQRRAQQEVERGERQAQADEREENERQWNLRDPRGSGRLETHAERAARESKEAADARAQANVERQRQIDERAASAQEASNEVSRGNLEVSRGNLQLSREKAERDANEPKFLSQAGDSNPYIVRYNPATQQMEQIENPNYDSVKVEAERVRTMLATQIQARNLTLDEAKTRYSMWYDQNVKTPLALAQEARDKAAEQRAALEADERRRQFAANFGLQKAELGQRAGAAAMSAEQSLLPYRAGPTESAEMSAAINSLGAGGRMDTNAAAGIHFTPGAFEFNAPNFKKIAAQAAKAALSGLTDYRPSDQQFQTADYSGVPAVSTSGAPTIPEGYGDFQGIIDNLKSTYNFGGGKG